MATTLESERLSTRGEDAQLRTYAQKPLDEACRRVQDVFAIVQYEKQALVEEGALHTGVHRSPGLIRQSQTRHLAEVIDLAMRTS